MSIVPNINDLKVGHHVQTPAYYTYDAGNDTYTATVLNYSFDDKVSVIAEAGGTGYEVVVLINGEDDLLFTGTTDGTFVVPKAVALECGALFESQVIDLSAGPMSYGRYLQLGATAEQTGAYLVSMNGSTFASDLATIDTFASIAMIDIATGTATLTGGVAIDAGYVEIAGGAMRIKEDLSYAGDLTLVSGWVKIVAQETATFTGIFNDIGNVWGQGAIDIVGGDMSIGEGATLKVNTWLSKGSDSSGAADYIADTLKFTGNFIVGANTDFTFYKKASLTVEKIADINGGGGTFTMADYDPLYNGDETIDVMGRVGQGESFNIGTSDVLVLGDPVNFNGLIESISLGTDANAVAGTALANGDVELTGVWNFVSVKVNGADTKTIVTMQDVADGLMAHIAFAGVHSASYFAFGDQIRGVTPSTVITLSIPPY